MTNIEDVQNSKRQSSGSRFIGIVAVFVVIGPPVGALAVTLLLAALSLGSGHAADGWADQGRFVVGAMLLGLVFGIPISYIVGAVPAALIGLATAAWDANKGRVPFYVPLGAALVLGVLAAGRLGRWVASSPRRTVNAPRRSRYCWRIWLRPVCAGSWCERSSATHPHRT